MKFQSVLNKIISRASSSKKPPVDCNLLEELQSQKYLHHQNAVRNETDPSKQIALKEAAAVFMISCRCKGSKAAKDIVSFTGLMAIDVDFKDNLHIANFSMLKAEICKIKNVAYCGLSIRGKGFFIIIPITHTDKHQQHFDWVQMYFASKGINIDPVCDNANRLRYHSFDPEAYYNHAAKPLQAYYKPPITKTTQQYRKGNNSPQLAGNVFSKAMEWVSNKGVQFVEGQRHEFIFLLCSYLQSKGVKKSDAENWIGSNLVPLNEITTNCIEYPYTNFTAGKEIEARQAPVKRPAPAKAITQPPAKPLAPVTPPSEQSEPTAYTLQQLEAMAIRHLNKTLLKDKVKSKANYMALWANDMAIILQEAGFTQQQFINSLN